MTQTWTSIGHAAELLHCDRELIRRWIDSGELLTRNHGVEVCLTVDVAASVDDMASIATRDGGRESALGLALAKLAQEESFRANRAAKRNRVLAALLGTLLVTSVAVCGYDVTRSRVACAVTAERLVQAREQNKQLMDERDDIRTQASRATADAAELRGRLTAMEKLREADAKQPQRAETMLDTLVAMLR